MDRPLPQLSIEIDVDFGDEAADLYQLTCRLRAELLDLDVHSVQLASGGRALEDSEGDAPEGSKAVGPLAVSGLVVRFIGHDVLETVVNNVWSWLTRQRCRSIRLTLDGDSLDLTNVSSAQQDKLVDLWVTRHAGSG